MYLDSLKIQNFRILEDVEVKKLGHVNLIVGKNNSGKSTVLEALALLASGFNPYVVEALAHRRDGLHISTKNLEKKFKINFNNFFSNRELSKVNKNNIFIGNEKLSLVLSHVLFTVNEFSSTSNNSFSTKKEIKILSENDVASLTNENTQRGLQVVLGDTSFLIPLDEESIAVINDYNLPLALVEPTITNSKFLAKQWDKLVFTEYEECVLKALQLIEPSIKGLTFLDDGNSYRFSFNNIEPQKEIERVPYVKLNNKTGKTPLYSMGDGITRLLQIILKVFQARDGFLLIDEFENGLHYSVQADVWRLVFKLAKEYNIQVFATTHSWDCIESFAQVAKESELDGVLFRMGRSVRKSDNGKVIATEFDEDELYNLTKDKIEVR